MKLDQRITYQIAVSIPGSRQIFIVPGIESWNFGTENLDFRQFLVETFQLLIIVPFLKIFLPNKLVKSEPLESLGIGEKIGGYILRIEELAKLTTY